jgi:hypothetical protein
MPVARAGVSFPDFGPLFIGKGHSVARAGVVLLRCRFTVNL